MFSVGPERHILLFPLVHVFPSIAEMLLSFISPQNIDALSLYFTHISYISHRFLLFMIVPDSTLFQKSI